MSKYRKKAKLKNRFREFIRVLNGVLQLTEREIDVLAVLMLIDDEWPANREAYKNILSTDSRRYIMEVTGIAKTNLTTYVQKFIDAGVVVRESKQSAYISKMFKAVNVNNTFEILFILDFKE